MNEGSNLNASLPTLLLVIFFILAILVGQGVSQYEFDLCFPNFWWYWAAFHVLISYSFIFL